MDLHFDIEHKIVQYDGLIRSTLLILLALILTMKEIYKKNFPAFSEIIHIWIHLIKVKSGLSTKDI